MTHIPTASGSAQVMRIFSTSVAEPRFELPTCNHAGMLSLADSFPASRPLGSSVVRMRHASLKGLVVCQESKEHAENPWPHAGPLCTRHVNVNRLE